MTGPLTGITSSLTSSVASTLGVAGNAAMEAAIHAGLQTMINNSAVALVNNRGDVGAALKDLGSSDFIRSLVTSMVAAGLTVHISDIAGIGPDLPANAPLADRIVQDIQRGFVRATVYAGVSTAIEGGSLDQNLLDALRLEASYVLGENVAQEIGAAFHNDGRSTG